MSSALAVLCLLLLQFGQPVNLVTGQPERQYPVFLLQVARGPMRSDTFTFLVDKTLKNLTIEITGRSVSFTLIGPSGESNNDTTGSLIRSSLSVGNLQTLQLETQVGQWEMRMVSTNPYTLKVKGRSPMDVWYDILDGTLDILRDPLKAGEKAIMVVYVYGRDSATVTEVALVELWGSGQIDGTLEPQEDKDYVVRFDTIPSVEFAVRMRGRVDNGSPMLFVRQSEDTIIPVSQATTTTFSPESQSTTTTFRPQSQSTTTTFRPQSQCTTTTFRPQSQCTTIPTSTQAAAMTSASLATKAARPFPLTFTIILVLGLLLALFILIFAAKFTDQLSPR